MKINGDKISAYTWDSCDEIDEIINYLNELNLTDEQYSKLEKMFDKLINQYSGMKESAWGDDV